MKIKSISPAGIMPVFNMVVDEHHNYMISGGVILKNCDALRYFCVTRTLIAERAQTRIPEDNEYDSMTDYDEEMTGGEANENYLTYGGG